MSSCSDMPVVVRVTYTGRMSRLLVGEDERALFFQAWQKTSGVADVREMDIDISDPPGLGVLIGFVRFRGTVAAEGRGDTAEDAVRDAFSTGAIPQDALWDGLGFQFLGGTGGAADAGAGTEADASPVPSGGNGTALPRKGSLADTMAAMERLGLVPRTRAILHEGEM